MSDRRNQLDQLGLVARRPFRHRILFAKTDAHPALMDSNIRHRLNDMPATRLTLDRRLLPADPIDYLAPLFFVADHGSHTRPLFAGSVMTADLSNPDTIEIKALGGRALAEAASPALHTTGVHPAEIVHLLARMAGLGEGQISIDAADYPNELCEVVVPIEGLRVDGRVEVGSVTFVDRLPIAGFACTHEQRIPDFFDADCYAITFPSASRLYDAEEQGLASIELAVAWILTRCRYGLAIAPSGTLQPFDRAQAIATPRMRDAVFVRALASQRRWLRSLGAGGFRSAVSVNEEGHLLRNLPDLPSNLDYKTTQAILGLARMAGERDVMARIGLLWEAIEFYVGSHKSPELFTSQERRKLKKVLPDWLSEAQASRARSVIDQMLNSPPLRQRLREVLDQEGVPWSEGELDDLWVLRKIRNDAHHGDVRAPASDELMMQATSFLARILIFRVHRLARRTGASPLSARGA